MDSRLGAAACESGDAVASVQRVPHMMRAEEAGAAEDEDVESPGGAVRPRSDIRDWAAVPDRYWVGGVQLGRAETGGEPATRDGSGPEEIPAGRGVSRFVHCQHSWGAGWLLRWSGTPRTLAGR